jgi:DNA repair protein RecN (Recombination protein N)
VLDELIATNLGIIQRVHLQPGPGLVAFTGETGAGKTMLMGALRLLIGGVARQDAIGPFGEETRVEGRFIVQPSEEFVAARTVAGGRSRAYLNGALVTAATLADLGDGLVEMVAQHEKHNLSRPGEVRELIDRVLAGPERSAPGEYRSAWDKWSALRTELDRLGGDRRALERELDLVGYQADEIASAGFDHGDDERLANQAARRRHAEELVARLGDIRASVDQAIDLVGGAGGELRKAAELDPSLHPQTSQSAEIQALLVELGRDVRAAHEMVDADPQAAAETEERLARLGDLRRKYGETLDEVLDFGEGARRRYTELSALLEGADRIEAELSAAVDDLQRAGEKLRRVRQAAADRLADDAMRHLQELGMAKPTVRLVVDRADPGPSGADTTRIEFASDDRLAPGPVGRVASGGELSRLVLSLRLAGGASSAPIVVFDEIDAGVGGTTALELGRKLAALAEDRQVLCVTHLPQVAAFADQHFVIRREGTTVTVGPVDADQRLEELTRMLSGLPDSEQGRGHAEELIALAAGRRG